MGPREWAILIVTWCMCAVIGGFAGYRMGAADNARERRKAEPWRWVGLDRDWRLAFHPKTDRQGIFPVDGDLPDGWRWF